MKVRRFLVWSVVALLTGLGTCNECPSSDEESVLHPDQTYTYRFRSEALAEAVGTTDDHSKIEIECEAHIGHLRECFYLLNLQDCALTAAGGKPGAQTPWIDRQPLPDLAKYPVEFSLVKGEIKEVNAHDEDPLPYLNIKRGVLSAFVFKMAQMDGTLHESHTDIHGTCPMDSFVSQADKEVKTSKDMLACHFPSRPDWQFSPWSLFWNMSFIQHVINSTTDCVYKIDSNQKKMEQVICKERHAIMLESTHRTTTAVQTNVHYHLVLVKSETQTAKPPSPILSRKTGIEYEYDETPVPTESSSPSDFLPVAEKMLSDLVSDSRDEIRLFTIPQFTDFVAWLRSSHDLGPLVKSVRDCAFLSGGLQCDKTVKDIANSYLSDALLQCNSLPCAKALTEMARSEELSPAYLDYLYYFWSFMHYSKTGFISNFADMCKVKNSQQCWISLGSFTYRTLSQTKSLDEKIREEAKAVAAHYHDRIGEECEVTENGVKRPTDCLIFMKAASNMGRYYGQFVPIYSAGIRKLLEIATNEHAQTVVRTTALEALEDIRDPDNQGERGAVYNLLLPVFRNESLPPSVRLLSFRLCLDSSEEYFFAEHLLKVLKDDVNPEVKYYVAETLNDLMTDMEFRVKREKFITSLTELLRENEPSLEWILYETKAKSRSSSHNVFLKLPFMPDSMQRFGLKIKDSFVYDSPVLPALFRENAVFQMFGTFLPASKIGTYVEGFEAMLQLYEKNLRDMNGKSPSLSQTLEAVTKTLAEFGEKVLPEGSLQNFDETVLSNVQKLRDLYWTHHKKLAPYAKSYIDLFGSTAKYVVYDDKQSPLGGDKLGSILRSAMQSLGEGVTYNTTRVIRVIEAYHQVPTLMGLPLNWTTNATLAFSLRAGLKYQMNAEDGHAHAKGQFQPSAALTFLNRMVLDFPTITQIGVQANSSGYTSTDFKAQYTSLKGKQSLRFDRPNKTQKLLQLFRTNQLIKHDRYENIPDWDFERVSSSWCTKDGVNSAAGLRFCLSKSYPNVTHLIKPWALMAGSCNWEFLAHPTNENDVHYGLELHQAMKHKLKEFNAKFSVTEKEKEKAARFKALIDENGKDMSVELKTNLLPDFTATLSRNELTWRKNVSGHKIKGALALFKDFKYEVELTTEAKVQRAPTKTSSHTDEDSQILVNEEKLTLDTPYSAYVWNKTVLKIGENVKADAYISYENLKGKSEWMKDILPPSFWENDQKASLKIQLHWKKPVHSEGGRVTRQTHFRLDIPRYVMTLRGDASESDTRSQINVDLARRDKNRGKLDAFLNFTSDWWTNEDKENFDKEAWVWNITIPRRSWSLLYQKLHEKPKYHYELAFKRALMKPRDQDTKSDYVGWWSKDVSDRFTVEEKEVKLTADNEKLTLSNEELVAKFPTLTIHEVEGLRSGVLASDIVLRYPFWTDIETLVFNGYFIFSTGPTTFRFQKDFDLTSSYNNLKLTSHSVYRTGSGGTELDHASYFTHLGSGAKAYNTIRFTSRKPDKCRHRTFKHDIRSSNFDLTTDAVYRCEKEDQELYTLRLNIDTNSSKWNMLDIKLDQIVEDLSSDYSREEMTTTHATGTIHVDAEWNKHPKHHQKKVVLCSKDGQCPNAELFLEFFGDGRSLVKFSLPNRNDTKITYHRKMSADSKNLDIKIGYSDNQEGSSDLLEFTAELIARNYHVWKGMVNANTFVKVRDLVTSGYKTFENAFADIAKDEKHPLNEMLRPALKTTLYEYWRDLKTQTNRFLSTCWNEVYEIFYTVEAFAEPAYNVLVNTMTSVHESCTSAYHSVRDKSVTIWAIEYFDVPRYFHQGITNLPHAIGELLNQLALGDENILHFKFITGKIVALTSLLEWPSIEFYPSQLKQLLSYETESTTRFDNWGSGHTTALIFGPLHVYTFDGRLYDVPAYPPGAGCQYLLAHDVHGSLFSVLVSETALHVLFPEMSLTVDEEGEVFVNGSRKPSVLPLQSANGKVTVKRSDVVEIWSPSLSVICRSRDFLCILKMSESHAGGIIGLLGNADTRPSNDYKLPNGSVSSNLVEFVRTYEVSGNPKCESVTLRATQKPSEEERHACLQEFGDTCTSQYQIREKFVEACASDVRDNNGACFATTGLAALCHLQHKPTHTTCNAVKPERSRSPIGRSLEVVLVVQENKYLTPSDKGTTPAKGIESLIRALDHKFKGDAEYESVRYALVGFGGNGVHHAPTLHSANKDVWLPADSMIGEVLKTLEFKSREESDAVQALKYSLEELGYDTFHSKVFVVITSKDKQVAEKHVLDYIQKRLEKNGLTLYVLSSYPSIEKGKKVFGVRADGLIFPSQSKEGDEYLDYPRGNLAKLASATRGSVFLSKFLRDNQPQAFFEEVAQEVWAKVKGEASKCRRCRPVPGSWWWYKQECAIVRC